MLSFFTRREKKIIPSWLKDYQRLDFQKKNPDAYGFAVLDCETTGLSRNDAIITIGAVLCSGSEIFTDKVLDQRYPLSASGKSSEIHGELANEDQIDLDSYLQELVEFLKNHIIVGHNISFDVGKINQLLQKKYGVKLKNHVLDTAQLAIRLDPVKYERTVGGQYNLSLDDLCKRYNIPVENRHTALGDAYLTAQLLQRLIYRLNQKGIDKLL